MSSPFNKLSCIWPNIITYIFWTQPSSNISIYLLSGSVVAAVTLVICCSLSLSFWRYLATSVLIEFQWVIRPIMTSHLPFSDMNPAHAESCVFTLDNSQRSSCILVYNCVCSFKCENVSLCASSTVPWHTGGAVHHRKGHSSYLTGLNRCGKWLWWLERHHWPFEGSILGKTFVRSQWVGWEEWYSIHVFIEYDREQPVSLTPWLESGLNNCFPQTQGLVQNLIALPIKIIVITAFVEHFSKQCYKCFP